MDYQQCQAHPLKIVTLGPCSNRINLKGYHHIIGLLHVKNGNVWKNLITRYEKLVVLLFDSTLYTNMIKLKLTARGL